MAFRSTVVPMTTVTVWLASTVPSAQATVPAGDVQTTPAGPTEPTVRLAGSVSVSATSKASEGPAFLTSSV